MSRLKANIKAEIIEFFIVFIFLVIYSIKILITIYTQANYVLGIVLLFNFLSLVFLIFRSQSNIYNNSLKHWLLVFFSLFLPLLFTENNFKTNLIKPIIFILTLINIFAFIFGLISLISLNKSFGALASFREVKTKFSYSLIRHPLYLSEIIIFLCFSILNYSVFNLIIFMSILICQIIRINQEEKLLLTNTKYINYCKKTKYKLIPFVW